MGIITDVIGQVLGEQIAIEVDNDNLYPELLMGDLAVVTIGGNPELGSIGLFSVGKKLEFRVISRDIHQILINEQLHEQFDNSKENSSDFIGLLHIIQRTYKKRSL